MYSVYFHFTVNFTATEKFLYHIKQKKVSLKNIYYVRMNLLLSTVMHGQSLDVA